MKELQDIDGRGEGFDFLIHTIGDAAVRQALNAIETSRDSSHETRHRLTHVELVHENDLQMFTKLGAIADPQVRTWKLTTIYVRCKQRRIFLHRSLM